ncbi:MAG: NHL repeat-containing protein [Planctomycetes bacterium]|nr:NHL repeat-containing protein [Planctomycetota bacterium]MCB9912103.1 NHL repeat-containing protein [Planctomycetota bacterium]
MMFAPLLLSFLPAFQADGLPTPEPPVQHLGSYVSTLSDFDRPTAIAYGPDGRLWIHDTDSKRLVAFDEKGELVVAVGWSKASQPAGISIDGAGHAWVSDRWNHQVFEVDGEGRVLSSLGLSPEGKPELLGPEGICHRGSTLLVADRGHGRVAEYEDGKLVRSLGEGLLQEPRDVCVDSQGRVAVVDSGLASVCVFDTDGSLALRFGEYGWFPGLFSDPTAIEVHGDRWYVADCENQRIQVFGPEGEPLYRIGTHAILPREGEGKLHYPTGLALHPNGERLAVTEPMDGRVQIFGMAPGAKPQVDPARPESVQPSPHYGEHWALGGGYLVIPEPESHRLRIFDLRLVPGQDPAMISEIGGWGASLGLFRDPRGVCLTPSPLTLLVADAGNERIVEVALDLDPEKPMEQTSKAARFVRAFDLHSWNAALPVEQRLDGALRPDDVLQTPSGQRFVLLTPQRTILQFDADWEPVARIQHSREVPLVAPSGMAWNEATQELAVSDLAMGRVLVFGPDGVVRQTIGTENVRRPTGLAYDSKGTLLVVDRWQSELFSYAPDGTLLDRRFHPGIDREGLYHPTDVSVDSMGRWWILDHGNHRGMIFDGQGAWLGAFGSTLYTRPARLPNAPKSGAETE